MLINKTEIEKMGHVEDGKIASITEEILSDSSKAYGVRIFNTDNGSYVDFDCLDLAHATRLFSELKECF